MYNVDHTPEGLIALTRIVVDRVRDDGLIFGSDFSQCDHSAVGYRKVMWRNKLHYHFEEGSVYWLTCEYEDVLKPHISKSRSGKTKYLDPKVFLHKVSNIQLVSERPDVDLLLDL